VEERYSLRYIITEALFCLEGAEKKPSTHSENQTLSEGFILAIKKGARIGLQSSINQ